MNESVTITATNPVNYLPCHQGTQCDFSTPAEWPRVRSWRRGTMSTGWWGSRGASPSDDPWTPLMPFSNEVNDWAWLGSVDCNNTLACKWASSSFFFQMNISCWCWHSASSWAWETWLCSISNAVLWCLPSLISWHVVLPYVWICAIDSRLVCSNSLVSWIWSWYETFHFCGADCELIGIGLVIMGVMTGSADNVATGRLGGGVPSNLGEPTWELLGDVELWVVKAFSSQSGEPSQPLPACVTFSNSSGKWLVVLTLLTLSISSSDPTWSPT